MRSLVAVFFSSVLILSIAPLAHAQAVLNNTTLGQRQNDDRDLVNSLVPGPQKYGKGEKKSQVSAAELKSKSIKDATFGGSLMNIGIDAAVPKLDGSKEHSAPSEEPASRPASAEQTSSASKQPAPTEQASSASAQAAETDSTFSSLTQTATLADDLGQADIAVAPAPEARTSPSSSTANDKQKKEQGGAEKPSTTSSTEKSSTTKPDGDH
ncbi:MAG TPA: hypothetical protein VLK27_01200 [Chthoniobacterales bacterium]|nr:hypothetical protein [Chthoniobacterales bacterium]